MKMLILVGNIRVDNSPNLVSENSYDKDCSIAGFGDALMMALEERDIIVETPSIYLHRIAPYVTLGLSMSYDVTICIGTDSLRDHQLDYLDKHWPRFWPAFHDEKRLNYLLEEFNK
jgi:hypothetical protein